jgi:Endosomal/lysosomal potassium channel TMEM175
MLSKQDGEKLMMAKGRLEAFTDGVIAIIITIMVLEIKAPQGGDLPALKASAPIFLAYALSYVNVGIFASSGTTTITCCMRQSVSMVACCGVTSCCCSGFRSFRS